MPIFRPAESTSSSRNKSILGPTKIAQQWKYFLQAAAGISSESRVWVEAPCFVCCRENESQVWRIQLRFSFGKSSWLPARLLGLGERKLLGLEGGERTLPSPGRSQLGGNSGVCLPTLWLRRRNLASLVTPVWGSFTVDSQNGGASIHPIYSLSY